MRFKHQAIRKVFQKQSKLLHFEDRLQNFSGKQKDYECVLRK